MGSPKLLFVGLAWCWVLAGCQSNQALVRDCCYAGPVTLVHFSDLELIGDDSHSVAFSEAFPGYRESSAWVVSAAPVLDEFFVDRVGFPPLANALARYDWNGNGLLEQPELTSFYVWESAKGFGTTVRSVRAGGKDVFAITASLADVGSLLDYVAANRARFDPDTSLLFRELLREVQLQRIENLGGGEALPS